jgi:hypothetical protein
VIFGIQNFFHDAFQQSHITVDANLHEQVGEFCTVTQPRPKLLWMRESVSCPPQVADLMWTILQPRRFAC